MNCKYKWNDYCIECIKFVEQIKTLNKNNFANLEYVINKAKNISKLINSYPFEKELK